MVSGIFEASGIAAEIAWIDSFYEASIRFNDERLSSSAICRANGVDSSGGQTYFEGAGTVLV